MKILIIGDIVGEPGRQAVKELVPRIRQRENIDMVIANGENAAGGSGLTPKIFDALINMGVDVVTSGDHVFKKKDILEIIDFENRLLRPANFPDGAPGHGYTIIARPDGMRVGVINLAGRVFMDPLDCPFRKADEIVKKIIPETNIILVDIHAEATSEKVALGWYLNGRVSAVVGTHTHVQTADERILPQKDHTAYISDIGMSGPIDSVIGRKVEQILIRFIERTPTRFEVAEENIQLQGVIIDIEEASGKAKSITRVQEKLSECPTKF